MVTPLFIKVYTTQHQAIQRDVEFYQVCLDHLGFLIEERGFEVLCEASGGPDPFAQIEFTDGTIRIRVMVWHPFGLPEFTVLGPAGSRRQFDLSEFAQAYGFGKGHRSFNDAYDRVHPLDRVGRRAVSNQYHEAVAHSIARFGTCMHENLERFTQAA